MTREFVMQVEALCNELDFGLSALLMVQQGSEAKTADAQTVSDAMFFVWRNLTIIYDELTEAVAKELERTKR